MSEGKNNARIDSVKKMLNRSEKKHNETDKIKK